MDKMTDKTVIVSNTGFMNTNDILKATVNIGIVPLLSSLDLKPEFDRALITALNKNGLGRDDAALAWSCQKLDELSEFIRSNQQPGGTSTQDLKALIQGWLAEHLAGGQNV